MAGFVCSARKFRKAICAATLVINPHRINAMLDINEALMRRSKLTPIKRKRSAPSSSKKVSSSSTGSSKNAVSIMRFTSKPLDELSMPTTKKELPSRPSSPQPTTLSKVSYESPLATVPTKQAYIDVGQKDFGMHITCRKCGLLYTAGEEEDEREHQRFCRQRQRGLTVTKWKNERILKSFPDEDARIIEIRANDPSLHVKKMLEVKTVLDDALGFVGKDAFLQRGHFLFIQAKQIVGCVTVERIEKALVFELESSNKTPKESVEQPVDVPAVLGICQLWVHPDFRGKGIATRLVDVVREKFIYGLLIAKNRMAFAQPTRNGLAFARSYVAPHAVLVYEATSPPITSPSAKRMLL